MPQVCGRNDTTTNWHAILSLWFDMTSTVAAAAAAAAAAAVAWSNQNYCRSNELNKAKENNTLI